MKKFPKISIVIPSYNKVDYIGPTLQSLLDQKYPNLEVLIRDPGSTDGTIEIIKKYVEKNPTVFRLFVEKDRGQLDAINKGLAQATGEVISYLNADDIYHKGSLRVVGEYFSRHPRTLWLAGKGETIDEHGRKSAPFVDDYKNYLLGLGNYSWLLIVNYFFQPSVFLSSKAYQKYGPFTGIRTSVMEYDMWLKMGKVKMPKVINRTLSSFRLTKGSLSTSEFKKILEEDEGIMEKYTTNQIVIMLHYLHNLGRVIMLSILGIR